VKKASARRGFTLIELITAVAVCGIIAALAFSSYSRTRPRARLASTAVGVQAMIHAARQQALSSGREVSVLFYPAQVTGQGTGRVVVYADNAGGFMLGGAALPAGFPSFCTFNPGSPAAPLPNDLPDSLDLPLHVAVAPPANPVVLPFPYNQVPPPPTGCSFCDAGMTQGAIHFDSRGRATFYTSCGTASQVLPNSGGSISFTSDELAGSRVLVVTPNGMVRAFDAE
jgi:prepilin-type N-terminal cleavage/methylation domain-containing protein